MKRITALMLSLVLAAALAVPASAQESSPFGDVPDGHWAAAAIARASQDGVMVGTGTMPETGLPRFSPDGTLTAGQFAVIVTQAFFWRELDRSLFDPWYAPYQKAAEQAGLTEGAGIVDWEVPMTRYQMAAMLYNLAAAREIPLPSEEELAAAREKIADWDQVPEQYRRAVAASYALGLLSGTDAAGTFGGDQTLTRAQAAVVYCKVNTDSPMERTLQREERKNAEYAFLHPTFTRYPGPSGTAYVATKSGTPHGGSVDMAYVYEDGSVLDINVLLPITARLGGVGSYLNPTEIQFDEAGEKLTFITPIEEGIRNENPGPDNPSMWLEVKDWGPTLCTVDLTTGTMISMEPIQ